jgi:hypothetical protein
VSQTETSFSNEQIDVICCFEQLWWEHGQLATDEKVSELTGVSQTTIRNYWKQEQFRNALLHRGVDINPARTAGLLTLTQLNLANLLLNVHDTRSVREKLNEVGVTSQQYHAWLRTPAFQQHLAKRGEEMFKSADWEAYESLVGAVRGQDISAIKLFFEMRGIYTPKSTTEIINIDVVLVRVVEVIARHVRDPETLQNIANDLELIEIGTPQGPRGMPILDVNASELTRHPVDEFQI